MHFLQFFAVFYHQQAAIVLKYVNFSLNIKYSLWYYLKKHEVFKINGIQKDNIR